MKMNEEEIRQIFHSLCTLSEQGPLPVQAYSILVTGMSPDTLAEELHRGWLADARFAPTAANIILHIVCASDSREVAVSSNCLALLLNDFRKRAEIRNESRQMARNAIQALFQMYPVYRELDACFSKTFIQPMFTSIDELYSIEPEAEDIQVANSLLCEFGPTLYELRPLGIERLVLRVRSSLTSESSELTTQHRERLLHIIDLHTHGWNELRIPDYYITGKMEETSFEAPHTELAPYVHPKRLSTYSTCSSNKHRGSIASQATAIEVTVAPPEEDTVVQDTVVPLEIRETEC